ncbi:MAG: hypothetical protein ED559_05085 [Phycisphaera sp.]|nr:MAG: hypothetical protein ED559_05085 [Phycisphaera sp.]
MSVTPACLAAMLAGQTLGQQELPTLLDQLQDTWYVGRVVQEFYVPGYVGSEWSFSLQGADGGDVERRRNGNRVEFREGGEGATIGLHARIGHGTGELAPGGILRYIIGEAGKPHGFISTSNGTSRGGAGGGGGSAILYLPPGETDWNNAHILIAAGAGGGGFIIGGPTTSADGDGAWGSKTECSTGPSLGCDRSSAPNGNCQGIGGVISLEGDSGPDLFDPLYNGAIFYHEFASGGAYPRPGHESLNKHGFPNGSDPVTAAVSRVAWGFGEGGMGDTDYGAGAGGGYSGGDTYKASGYSLARNFDCKGGGGGGGSYINDAFLVVDTDTAWFGNSFENGHATSAPVVLTLDNDEPAGAVVLADGMFTAATLDQATDSAVTSCSVAPGADLWYRYTNTGDCVETLSLSSLPLTIGGAPLSTDVVQIDGFTGAIPSASSCRGSSVGSYNDSVEPGETVLIRVSAAGGGSPGPDVNALLTVSAFDTPNTPSPSAPIALVPGVGTTESFCGGGLSDIGSAVCDPGITQGFAAYYEFVNPHLCDIGATFSLTSGSLNGLRIFSIENVCQEAMFGSLTETLAPGERMLIEIISQTGEPVTFRIDTDFTGPLIDCDNDGIPDSCDIDGACEPPANDLAANAEPISLPVPALYDTRFATRDGSSNCEFTGQDVDVWYSYTAPLDGQLVVNLVSDAGDQALGLVGLAAFTADGLTQLDCDRGEDAGRAWSEPGQAVGLVSMRQGETVLVRVSVPPNAAEGSTGTGFLEAGFDATLPNDTCRNATEIVMTDLGETNTVYRSMERTQNEGSTGFCFDTGGVDQYDVWFTFTAPVRGEATFESLRGGAVPLSGGFELYDGCSGTLLACDSSDAPAITHAMTAGESVTLRLLRSADTFDEPVTFVRLTLAGSACGLADTNGDGVLTPADFTAWINAFNNQAPECDQNGDDQCTPADFTAWIANYNAGC